MSHSNYREVLEPLSFADFTALTVGTTEVFMPAATSPFAAIPANYLVPGRMLKLTVGGLITTTATGGNITINPRYGTGITGVLLGASAAIPKVISLTAVPFFAELELMCRTAGSSGTAVAAGRITSGAFGASATAPAPISFGGASATIDTTTAQGLGIGVIASAATADSITPKFVKLESLN